MGVGRGNAAAWSDWSAERVEQLGQLWTAGKSAREITLIMGGGVTRSAVIGKVHRLGLAGRPRETRQMGSATRKPPKAKPAPTARIRPPQGLPEPEPACGPTLMERGPLQCCWPVGQSSGADQQFCGALRGLGAGPYCPRHQLRLVSGKKLARL